MFPSPDCELLRVELCSDVQNNIVLCNVYRPPSGKLEACIDSLTTILDNEDRVDGKELVFLGDFNVDFASKKSAETKQIIS